MKNRSKRKIVTVILCIAFAALALSACDDADDIIDDPDIPDPGEQVTEVSVQLFYGSMDYVNTGSETAESPMMMPAYPSNLKVETDDAMDVYEKTLELLERAPGDDYISILSPRIDLDDVYLKDKTCYVSFDKENLIGGAMEEEILINQIVSTLCASFTEVEQVQFQIEGMNADTLMGQMDTSKPFKAGDNGKALQVR